MYGSVSDMRYQYCFDCLLVAPTAKITTATTTLIGALVVGFWSVRSRTAVKCSHSTAGSIWGYGWFEDSIRPEGRGGVYTI